MCVLYCFVYEDDTFCNKSTEYICALFFAFHHYLIIINFHLIEFSFVLLLLLIFHHMIFIFRRIVVVILVEKQIRRIVFVMHVQRVIVWKFAISP